MDIDQEFRSGFVAVLGKPNVGKSTFINHLMGQKIAAVSPRSQTTRRQQLGILTTDEAQIIFTDTPGVHEARNNLGNYMNEEAVYALQDSDLVLFLVDVSQLPDSDDKLLGELIWKAGKKTPIFLVANKIDQAEAEAAASNLEAYEDLIHSDQVFTVSALLGYGMDQLLDKIVRSLPEHPPFYPPDQITDLYEREIAADLIREAALNILRDEVPHGIAIRIDEFTERSEDNAYIAATIFVERDSQKGIVIGENGKMIKQLGIEARKSIEEMSGRKIYLNLRVKVRKNWRNDENSLRLFGFRGRGKGI